MKCFECGEKCLTNYIYKLNGMVKAVSKLCPSCGWESYPTKIPDPIAVDVQACTSTIYYDEVE
ncbi:MAG: hypothetical protein ACTSUO_09145 [Candidatus Thorarchaeota archaeon]